MAKINPLQAEMRSVFFTGETPGVFYAAVKGYYFTLFASKQKRSAPAVITIAVSAGELPEGSLAKLQEGSCAAGLKNPRREGDCLFFTLLQTDTAAGISQALEQLAEQLSLLAIPAGVCLFCGQPTAESVYINEVWAPAHRGCAHETLKDQKSGNKRVMPYVLALLVTVLLVPAIYFLAVKGLMVSLAAILMGLGAGACLLFAPAVTRRQIFLFSLFALLALAVGNTISDYLLFSRLAKPYSFWYLYTIPLNQFNTAFDLLSGCILYYLTISALLDHKLRRPLSVRYSKVTGN